MSVYGTVVTPFDLLPKDLVTYDKNVERPLDITRVYFVRSQRKSECVKRETLPRFTRDPTPTLLSRVDFTTGPFRSNLHRSGPVFVVRFGKEW